MTFVSVTSFYLSVRTERYLTYNFDSIKFDVDSCSMLNLTMIDAGICRER